MQPRHPRRTFARLLQDSVREHAERDAILAPGRQPLTYARLGWQIEETASALAAAGYGRGSRIAVALPAGPEFAVAVLALTSVVVCAPLNRTLDEDALAALLSAMRIDALVARPDDVALVHAARRASVPILGLRSSSHDGAGLFELDVARQRRPVSVEPVAADDIALLGHTSGTTSRPKIVPYEQWRLTEAVRNRAEQCGFSDADRSLLLSPLFALGATRRSLVPPLLVGGSVICPTAVDGQSVVAILETMGPTQVVASPATLRSMLSEFERRRPRPSHTLRQIYSSFSELPAQLRSEIEDAFSVPVLVNYGMSETGSIAETPLPPVSTPVGSVGLPTSLEVAVADEDERRLGAGETGEIIVRGAEVMPGYENDEAASRQAFRDGWFRTGDTGWIDRDGFVYLSGRLKDIVNRGGMKIGPGEVANALARHPQVAEAAAFGMPHPTLGEDLAAAVVMRDGASAGEQELRDFLRTRLPPFKVPSLIFTVSEMPRGALDKTDRSELVRMARQRIRTDFEAPAAGIETEVASIFASVLEIAVIGRRDNFFHRGGDSLRGVRVVAAVEEAFGLAVSVDLLFDHPTVAAFAAELRLLLGLSADPAKPLPQEVPAGTSGTVAAVCGVTDAADPTINRNRR